MDFCLTHKETITSLDFDYTTKQLFNLSILSSAFKNTTKLSFHNHFSKDLTFMQVQEAFSNLPVFYFKSKYLLSDEIVQTQIDRIGDQFIHFNKNLKTLKIAAHLSLSYVKYVTKYLLNQLKKIHLSMSNTYLHVWTNDVGEKNVLELMERLNSVKNVGIFFLKSEKEYDATLVHYGISKTNHFEIANALIGNKKITLG